MAHNVTNMSKAQTEVWEMMANLGYTTLPDLKPTIINMYQPGVKTVHLPYVGIRKATSKPDGTDVTYASGTVDGIDITVNDRGFHAEAFGKIAQTTSLPSTTDEIAFAAGAGILDYEAEAIVAKLLGITPARPTMTVDASAVTVRDDIGDMLAGALGQSLGRLAASRNRSVRRTIMVPAEFAGLYMTTEKFTNANYAGLFGGEPGRPILGMQGSYLGAAICAWPAMTDEGELDEDWIVYSDGKTTITCLVYNQNAAGILVASPVSVKAGYDMSIGDDAIHVDNVFGVAEGLDTCIQRIEFTVNGDPFQLAE